MEGIRDEEMKKMYLRTKDNEGSGRSPSGHSLTICGRSGIGRYHFRKL